MTRIRGPGWRGRGLFDRFIEAQVQQGVQVIINVAAGLDARPYRMDLPATLSWIEVDRQEILDYKNRIIGDAAPKCLLERRALDFRDLRVQTEFLSSLDASKKTLVVTEGYLIYLTAEEVSVLAGNLADRRQISAWAADIVSPGLLHMLQANTELNDAARLQFGPANGPQFFRSYGWGAAEVESLLTAAAKIDRVPLFLMGMVNKPADPKNMGERPWGGVCLLRNLT